MLCVTVGFRVVQPIATKAKNLETNPDESDANRKTDIAGGSLSDGGACKNNRAGLHRAFMKQSYAETRLAVDSHFQSALRKTTGS
jgi:hypothetical protein